MPTIPLGPVVVLLVVFAAATPAHAQTDTWDGSTSNNWFTASNGSPATVPNTNTADARFVGPATVTVKGSPTVNDLYFDSGTGGAITLTTTTGSGITLAGTLAFIQQNRVGTVTLTGGNGTGANPVFTLSSDIVFNGSGTSTLTVGGDTENRVTTAAGGGAARNIEYAFDTACSYNSPNLFLGTLGYIEATGVGYKSSLTMTSGYVQFSRGGATQNADSIDTLSVVTINGGTLDLDGSFENFGGLQGSGGDLQLSGVGGNPCVLARVRVKYSHTSSSS